MKRASVSIVAGLLGWLLSNSTYFGALQGLASYFFYQPGLVPPNADGFFVMYIAMVVRLRAKQFIQLIMKLGFGPKTELERRRKATSKHTELHEECTEEVISLSHCELFVYRPKIVKTKGAVIYYHGGGMAMGQVRFYRKFITNLAVKNGVTVFSPDYRKAPENPYPIPVDDCLEAGEFVFDNAERLGIDPTNVIYTGDSAGGYMSVSVWYRLLLKNATYSPSGMSLLYPCLGGRQDSPSFQRNNCYPPLTYESIACFMFWFIGEEPEAWKERMLVSNELIDWSRLTVEQRDQEKLLPYSELADWKKPNDTAVTRTFNEQEKLLREKVTNHVVDPLYAPMLIADKFIKDLPRTKIFTCEADVLKNDGQMWAGKCRKNNVQVDLVNIEGAIHSIAVFSSYFGFFPKGNFVKVDQYVEEYYSGINELMSD